jgi:hypothetical protein
MQICQNINTDLLLGHFKLLTKTVTMLGVINLLGEEVFQPLLVGNVCLIKTLLDL